MPETSKNLQGDRYHPGDEADILAMNRAEYGLKNIMVTQEAFHWRYDDNPAGQTEITVVRDQQAGRVIGFTWTIPIRMRLFGKDYVAALTANQLIHPDYRDSLAYIKLIRRRQQWMIENGIPFRYNFPIESLYKRTGSIEKMSSFLIPLLVRPVNPVLLAKRLFKPPWVSRLIGWGGCAVSPLIFHSKAIGQWENPLKIEWLEQFDQRFDDLWLRVQDKYAIMAVRNRDFLSWRFAPVAERRYRILIVSAGEELAGYAVLRCTDEIRGIPIGLIMDLLLEPGARGEAAGYLLMEGAWRYFKMQQVWIAGGLTFPHTSEYETMQHAGYRALPDRLTPRLFRVAFNCFGDDLPETTQIKSKELFITIADYEAH